MRNKLSNPILFKAANAEFGRSIATGAATLRGFAKENGFSYPRPMYAWRSSSFFARSRSLGEEGKTHLCEELCRFGGETVYVSGGAPNGLTEDQYRGLLDGERSRWNWRVMRRNPKVYVRGRVRHPDHQTVVLGGWHEVLSNTENLSYAMRHVAFLD